MADTAEAAGPDRRRLTALALGALAVLGVGALLRPDDPTAEPPISLSESATLRSLSRRAAFQDMAEFAAERVALVERFLVYLPDLDRAGVLWRSRDSAVTAGGDSLPLRLVGATAGDSGAAAVAGLAGRLKDPQWVLIAARQAGGGLASSVGLSGGVVRLRCGEAERPALLLSVPLSPPLAGAGVFDLDGALLAVVARCGPGYSALPVTEIDAALRSTEGRPTRVLGMELAELDSLSRRYFRADSGAVVVAVAMGSPGKRGGVRPGDVILDPAALAAPSDSTRTLALIRGGQVVRVPLATDPAAGDLGLELAEPEGIAVAQVTPGTRAARAGLRAGDRILRLDGVDRLTREAVLQALGTESAEPRYLVFRRDGDERGTFLLP
jgi:hypothetical protein